MGTRMAMRFRRLEGNHPLTGKRLRQHFRRGQHRITRTMKLLPRNTSGPFPSNTNLENRLFCGALLLYTLSFSLNFSNVATANPQALHCFRIVAQAVALFFLIGKLALSKFSKDNSFALSKPSKNKLIILVTGLTVLFACLVCAGSDTIPFIWTLLFVFAAKNVNIRTAAIASLIALSMVLIFSAIGSQIGLIPDVVLTSQDLEIKRSLGFNHPNQLGLMLFSIAGAFSIARQGTFKAPDIFVYLAIGLLLFLVSGARTSEIAYISLIALLLLNQTIINKKIVLAACMVLVVVIAISSIGIMLFYNPDNSLLSELNSLLSQRFYFWNLYASTYPPTLFGRNFEGLAVPQNPFVGSSAGFVTDNVFCYIALHLGMIPLLIFAGIAIATLFTGFKSERCDAELLVFVAFLIFGFGESHSFWIGLNISLLAIARCFETKAEGWMR